MMMGMVEGGVGVVKRFRRRLEAFLFDSKDILLYC